MSEPIYIFGASTNGEQAYRVCGTHGIPVAAFLDNYAKEPEFCGRPVLRPGGADRALPVVVTSPHHCLDITLQLDWLGFRTQNLSQFYSSMGLEPDWASGQSLHRAEYGWLRDTVADEQSRRVFDAVVKFRKTLDPLYPAAVCSDHALQWFDPDLFRPGPHVFVDGGAYDGDTAEAFIKACPEYESIHCFEPSAVLADKARERLKGHRDVTVHALGLDGVTGAARLENSGTPSGRKGVSGDWASFVSLDDMVGVDMKPPTFIKLDVEGCEIQALKGAQRTIRDCRPFLAVAVYHRPDDLWAVPKLLSTMQNYTFYLRHYTQFYHETVLYCV